MKYKFFILLIIFPFFSYNQTKTDSLEQKLNQTSGKFEKIKILRELSITSYRNKKVVEAKKYCNTGIQIAEQIQDFSKQGAMTNLLARIYRAEHEYKLAEKTYKEVIVLYDKAKNVKASVKSNIVLGSFYLERGDRLKALNYAIIAAQKLDKLLKQTPHNKELLSLQTNIYTNLGLIALGEGQYQKAEDYFEKTVITARKINDKKAIIRTCINWGLCLKKQSKDAEAIPLYEEAYKLSKEINYKVAQGMALNNLGIIYDAEQNYEKALEYYEKALKLKEESGKEDVLPYTLNNIASIYTIKGIYDKAEQYYQRSLAITRRTQERDKEAATLLGMSKLYQTKNDFEAAFKYFKNYTTLNDSLNNVAKNKQVLDIETKYETEKKEQENILLRNQTLLQESAMQAQILKQEQLKLEKEKQTKENKIKAYIIEQQELQEDKLKVESEKRKKENEVLKKTEETQNAKLLAQKAHIQQQYTTITAIAVGLSLLFLLAGILYKNNLQKQKANILLTQQKKEIQITKEEVQVQNEELQQQQEEIITQRDYIESRNKELARQNTFIKSSINAALTIQDAILPFRERIEKFLPNYFVFSRAKDVVSGDFYWIENIENYAFVILADCTGHGVSGAFMAMIGHTLLDRIITFEKTYEPTRILDKLHQETQRVLRQQKTGNNNGMDLAILRIEEKNKAFQIAFAGAKRPFYYWDNRLGKIQVLKGTRKSIGGIQNEEIHFEQHDITLHSEDVLYLFSDGYSDQNNLERKKLGAKKFRNLLTEIADKPLKYQEEKLEETLNIYMKHTEQRDDILVLGIKL